MAVVHRHTKSFQESNEIDFLGRRILEPTVRSCSRAISKPTARSQSRRRPEDSFAGVGGLMEHIFITAGDIRDDAVSVAERLEKHRMNVELVVQEGCVHDDMFIDVFTREKKLGTKPDSGGD
jgi:hypothetical protein